MCSADCVDVAAAADFALNPFSRMGKRAAFDFAAAIRGNRLIDKEACLALLREESRAFEYFEDLVESPEAATIAGVFEDAARSIGAGREAYTKEQLGNWSAARCVWRCLRDERRPKRVRGGARMRERQRFVKPKRAARAS